MKPRDKNPAVPYDGQTILIGVIGIDEKWIYFDDNTKGREAALKWMQGMGLTRLFRVYIGDVEELVLKPPTPAKLVEKTSE